MLVPSPDRLLLKTINVAEDKIGSIIIPQTTKERQLKKIRCLVKNIGVVANKHLDVVAADIVIAFDGFGTPIRYENEDYILLKHEHVLAKIERE